MLSRSLTVFACHQAACAPPPVGSGGSSGAGGAFGKGADALFKGHAKIVNPLQSAGRLKKEPLYDKEKVAEVLRGPVRLKEFDPRELRTIQPSVTREGVNYYLGKDYGRTGKTFADPHVDANKYPLVYKNPRNGQLVLLHGNHRAVAALVKGETLQARYVEG